MLSPLWRHAPARAWRRGGYGVLLAAALTAATASAASVPMFTALAGDSALASTLASVPEDARTSDAPAVRLIGADSPRSAEVTPYQERLGRIPGLTPATTVGRSVGSDLHYLELFRPLVRANGIDARARLLAVGDPAAELAITSGSPRPGGVWLPDPVARALHVTAGDTVSLLVQTSDATHPPRKDAPPPVVAPVVLAGTYAVAADGRRPADIEGRAGWSRRVGWLPTDSELTTLPAFVVVGDVATVDALADRIGDQMLWSVEAKLDPDLTLDEAGTTAAAVADLRREVRTPDGSSHAGPLQLGLVSGIEPLVARAQALADATAQRGELIARAGIAAGLLAALVIAILMALDRRRELAQGASTGVGPLRTAGLWALEAVTPAAVAAVLGVLVARGVLAVAGPVDRLADRAVLDGAVRAAAAAGFGVLLVAVVGTVAVLVVERTTSTASSRRFPWVPVLTAVAGVAVVATVTTPATSAGPVALAVPALVAAATGACLAVLTGWSIRRALARSSARLPATVPAATRWLALRRLAGPGADRPAVVAVAALGLGMALFALTAVAATRVAVADRVAVATGARVTAQVDGSWLLDATTPHLPTVAEVADGEPVPSTTTPAVPDGMTLVWRTPVSVAGEVGSTDLLVADASTLATVASWGDGQTLADARAVLPQLDDADRAALASPSSPIPVIAVAEPGFHVGDELTLSGQDWSTPVRVVASVTTFPGAARTGTLVAGASSFLQSVARWDPRLAPSVVAFEPRPIFETWLWSSRPAADVTRFLDSHAVQPTALATADQAAQVPALAAAERSLGYQVALAVFLALTALVAASVYARRLARRSRGADALLARVGLGRRGVAVARGWEVLLVVLVALVAAIVANLLVAPLGPLLLDLDRASRPAYELRITPGALLATGLVAAVMVVSALLVGVRPMTSRRGPTPEEVVLRDDG